MSILGLLLPHKKAFSDTEPNVPQEFADSMKPNNNLLFITFVMGGRIIYNFKGRVLTPVPFPPKETFRVPLIYKTLHSKQVNTKTNEVQLLTLRNKPNWL